MIVHSSFLRAAVAAALLIPVAAPCAAMTFHLLCWTNDTPELPTAVGRRPAVTAATTNDWLVFTPDDDFVGGTFNPYGALSHSFEDIAGVGGALADAMPSLSGSFEIVLSPLSHSLYTVAWQRVALNAQIEPNHRGHIQIAHEDDEAIVTNPVYGIDGGPNAGAWQADTWHFTSTLDMFAEHAHMEPLAVLLTNHHVHNVAHAHNNQVFSGWLVPLDEATPAALASNMPADVVSFYPGAFDHYMLSNVLPRVPGGATHVLVLQSAKQRVSYSVEGMTTNSLFGMTLLAYSYDEIPEPVTGAGLAGLLGLAGLGLVRRGTRRPRT